MINFFLLLVIFHKQLLDKQFRITWLSIQPVFLCPINKEKKNKVKNDIYMHFMQVVR